MDYIYCTTTREKGSHFTYQDRQALEKMVIENHRRAVKKRISQSEMAEKLAVHHSTISQELKRGRITQRNTMLEEYISYFLHFTNRDLPRRGKRAKRKYRRVRQSSRAKRKSIDQRLKVVNERSEFGHQEMDCVESGLGGRSCLFTLVERQTNYSLHFKLSSQSQKQVQNQLDRLNRRLGHSSFSVLFKTITVDNGSEFLDVEGLMSSLFIENERQTEIYYCHPYCSFERGSNDQMNGQIRLFISKSSDISKVSKKRLSK